jgi:hypothetical protein
MVVMLAAPDDRDALAHAGRDLLREEPQGFVVERRAVLPEKEVDAAFRVRHEPLRHLLRRPRDAHRACLLDRQKPRHLRGAARWPRPSTAFALGVNSKARPARSTASITR